MAYNEKDFIQAVEKSFKMYELHGARSTSKLLSIHKYMANVLLDIFGADHNVFYLGDKAKGDTTKEKKVEGKYYPKNIDITITKGKNPIFCLGIKFVTSNYKQNANNYFENMMGETANIQRANIPYAHLIILRQKTPYYKRSKTISKWETIDDHDIKKYSELMFDITQAHKPIALAIPIINIDTKGKISFDNLTDFSVATQTIISSKLSIKNLIDEITSYSIHLKIR